MTPSDLKTAIAKQTAGVYLLCGEEDYLKRYYLREFRKALTSDPSLDAFNHLRIEGEKIDFSALLDALSTPPMLADKKLVEYHLCDFNALRDKEIASLAEIAESVRLRDDTILVFLVAESELDIGAYPKKPSKLFTELNKIACVTVFERSSDTALASWLERHFNHFGVRTDPPFLRDMISYCGHSMEILASESEKIAYFLLANGKNTADGNVLRQVSVPNPESDAFGLSNAVLEGDGNAAFRALTEMKRRRADPTMLLGSLLKIYSDLYVIGAAAASGMGKAEIAKELKIHEYKVGLYQKAIGKRSPENLLSSLERCRAYDMAAKSGGLTGYTAIERLIAAEIGNM